MGGLAGWWSSKSGRAAEGAEAKVGVTGIASLNSLTPDVAVVPSYTPKLEHRRIDFYYADDDELLIAGVADNNYVFWLSRTRLDDVETNEAIFNHLARVEPELFGHVDTVARKLGYGPQKLGSFYRDGLSYVGGPDPAGDDQVWQTPFGVRYIKSQERYNGSYFAKGVIAFRARLKRRCAFREAGERYLEIMRWYLDTLWETSGDPVRDYESKRELIELIHEERYLLCSDDAEVRKLYLRLSGRISEMYNAYMSIVR